LAAQYIEKGFNNVTVLGGGVKAWQEAGFPIVTSQHAMMPDPSAVTLQQPPATEPMSEP
jgi:3-mercaptopyruvate sulfurtransferase SseA